MNEFNKKYTTKIPRLNIPLVNFSFFHGVYSENEKDPNFIGRTNIVSRLKSWLTDSKIDTGVYLVTGFRGMGKSSFVGRVLDEITYRKSKLLTFCVRLSILFIPIIACLLFLLLKEKGDWSNNLGEIYPRILIGLMIIMLLFSLILIVWDIINNKKNKEKLERIPIKINLGHENLNEKNILSLISRSIEDEYHKFRTNISMNRVFILFEIIVISIITFFISWFFSDYVLKYLYDCDMFKIKTFWTEFKQLLEENEFLIYFLYEFVNFIVFLLLLGTMLFISKTIYKILYKIFDTPVAIEKSLKDLNSRITAQINTSRSSQTKMAKIIENIGFDFSFSQNKEKKYPLADAREIELELVNILRRMCAKRIWFFFFPVPKFIIVFDELDKIDPRLHYEMKEQEDVLPEFEHIGSGFPGGAASRKRKHTLLKMLANMKFFVSTAKTKFIFIAGRELYDAFLADFSDREFAIGSIFSNVIYVDSFLSSILSKKDVTNMTEQYICKHIIVKNDNNLNKLSRKMKVAYIRHSLIKKESNLLGWIRQFVNMKWFMFAINNGLITRGMIKWFNLNTQKFYHNEYAKFNSRIEEICKYAKDEDQYYSFKTYNIFLFLYKMIDCNITDASINKTLMFLQQFAVYLAHISNGAPKKIAIHFEDYIQMYESKGKGKYCKDSGNVYLPSIELSKKDRNYYLSFGYRDQQKIGFIHYMAFPVVNALINNATQYGDKLLVSACFLTNHIYK